MKRRAFLANAGAATALTSYPIGASAEDTKGAVCSARERFGDWAVSVRVEGDEIRKSAASRSNKELFEASRVQIYYNGHYQKAGSFKGTPIKVKNPPDVAMMSLDLEIKDTQPLKVMLSWPSLQLEDGTELDREELKYDMSYAILNIDGVEHQSYTSGESGKGTGLGYYFPSDLHWDILDAQTVNVEVRLGSGEQLVSGEVEASGLRRKIERATHTAFDRVVADIKAKGSCKPNKCVLTSAAVETLGRPDDCFELTQMRKLRAEYGAQYPEILTEYVCVSEQILSGRFGVWQRMVLVLFWAFIVLPVSALIYCDKMQSAKALYLWGFGGLRSVFRA